MTAFIMKRLFATILIALGLAVMPYQAHAQRWQSNTVYVVNHTSWPARSAAASLSHGSKLNVKVVSSCYHRRQCVTIRYGRPHRGAVATTYYGGAPYLEYADIIVKRRGISKRDKRVGMCHELGHAVGLQHSSSRKSCMYWRVGNDVAITVGRKGHSKLHRMYR